MKNGATYTGGYANGKYSDFGVYKWADGRTYHGAWLNGNMCGEYINCGFRSANCCLLNSVNFHAVLIQTFAHKLSETGHGINIWANGDSYHGKWQNDQMHGSGNFKYANGTTYSGQFQDHNRHGEAMRCGFSLFAVLLQLMCIVAVTDESHNAEISFV